jgi:hypothetical protein
VSSLTCAVAACTPRQNDRVYRLLPPGGVTVRVCALGHFTVTWTAQPEYDAQQTDYELANLNEDGCYDNYD